jgi:ABC-type sugar transport system ATPase subunit
MPPGCGVLIVAEPTARRRRRNKVEIYALMRGLAAEGLAILMISSDLPEVLAVSDRILVMRVGRPVGEIAHADATEKRIMALAGVEHSGSAA